MESLLNYRVLYVVRRFDDEGIVLLAWINQSHNIFHLHHPREEPRFYSKNRNKFILLRQNYHNVHKNIATLISVEL